MVDAEERLVGVLTVDDAMAVLEEEESEDMALQGGRSDDDGVQLTNPSQARGNVAPKADHVEVGPQVEQLCLASSRPGADLGTGG